MADRPVSAVAVFAALPVRVLEDAAAWYSRLFGRPPDQRPGPTLVDWYLAPDGDPHHGTLQLIADAVRAGGGLATVNVAEIEGVLEHLGEVGIAARVRELPVSARTASSVRIASVLDPDGNLLNIVEARP